MSVTVHTNTTCQGDLKGSEDNAMATVRHIEISDQKPAQYTEQYLLNRLIAAGVGSLDDWRALSPRARRNIFGITVGMARAIDGIANARRHREP
jgi:hypothetical protein